MPTKEFMQVVYSPKKGVTKAQWFMAEIPAEYHDIYHNCMRFTGELDVSNVIKQIKNINKMDLYSIKFIPVIEPVPEAKHNGQYECGWDTTKGRGIEYRGGFFPRFSIKFINYGDDRGLQIWPSGNNYSDLTDGMRSSICTWFSSLSEYLTQDLLTHLKEEEKKRYLADVLDKASRLQTSLYKFVDAVKAL